jgi:hypothetical protein
MNAIKSTNTKETLILENRHFAGTGGISQNNKHCNFVPAFLDSTNGRVYRSRFADGTPAPVHILDGLPDKTVIKRDRHGTVVVISDNIISGFVREGRFYTRKEAADYN